MANISNAIDELRENLQIELAARMEAERASRLKDKLLLTVSQKLRTPLTAVLGWSQLLREIATGQTLAEGLEAIERNAQAQRQLIDDLLDTGRIMTGRVRLDSRPLHLATVIDAVVRGLRPIVAWLSWILKLSSTTWMARSAG